MAVQNRLLALMGEVQAKTNRPITQADVARAVGISNQALNKWIHNDVKSYSAEVLDKLCEFFKCEVGDILVRVPDSNTDIPSQN